MFTICTLTLLLVITTDVVKGGNVCNYDGYLKSGCFKSNKKLFHDLLITDLDETHEKWGKHMDWGNLQNALQSLACRCEALSRHKGYAYFAIGFYGECWAGKNREAISSEVLKSGSDSSSSCVGGDYGICDHSSSEPCAGVQDNEYVYEIVQEQPVTTTPAPGPTDGLTCTMEVGDGQTLTEATTGKVDEKKLVKQTPEDCVRKCLEEKKKDDSINGVTIDNDDKKELKNCWCERNMGVIRKVKTQYKSCFLVSKGDKDKQPKPGVVKELYSDATSGYWGDWGTIQNCPNNHYVNGFQLKSEAWVRGGDDTALNGVKLFCNGGGEVTSTVQKWGSWGGRKNCPGSNNPVIGFRMKIEKPQGGGKDDTAANSVDLYCKHGGFITGVVSTGWGDWSPLLKCPEGMAVVGLQTRVERWVKSGDDTALNGVNLMCAVYNDVVENSEPYKYVSTKKTWSEANADCKAWGGHLTHVTNQQENNQHLKEMRERKGFPNAWIGLTDEGHEGKWTYVGTNTRAWFTYWNRGEPNNLRSEQCAHMFLPTGLWNDLRCTAKLPYICQKDGTSKVKELVLATHPKYVFESEAKTWEDAEKDCKAKGGDLASITNQQENDEIWKGMKSRTGIPHAWIGINDKAKEGQWMLSGGMGSAKYTHWNNGEPNNLGSEQCTMMYAGSGKWNDAKCTNKYPYVCQVKGFAGGLRLGSTFRFRSTNYPGRLFRHRGFKVWLDPVSNADLYVKDSSFKIVNGLDGKGISFESVNYPGLYLRHTNFHLDLNKNDGSELFRKDASFTVQTSLDGQHGAISFQSVNYPDHYIAHSGFRVYIRKFQNTDLYKHDASWSPVSTTLPKYVYEPRGKTWEDAEKDCKERGGDLAYITNQQENHQVWKGFKSRPGIPHVWIGINDKVKEGQWMLSGGLGSAKYTHWHKGEPNNLGSEQCTMMYGSSGKWNDSKCTNKYPYVCQVEG